MGNRERKGSGTAKAIGLVVGGGLLVVAASPPMMAAAAKFQDVVVRNAADDPVPVAGAVSLTEGTEVALADGTVVSIPAGTTVGIDGTVRLADGTVVELPPGTRVGIEGPVQLADGSVVDLAPDARVGINGTVQLADGSAVRISNDSSSPVPVRIVDGSAGGAAPEQQAFSIRSDASASDSQSTATGIPYTVPAGKTFVITGGHGFVTDGVRRVVVERRSCGDSGNGLYQYGEITGPTGGKVWHLHGESRAAGGCQLVPSITHATGDGTDQASFHLYGYLVDTP